MFFLLCSLSVSLTSHCVGFPPQNSEVINSFLETSYSWVYVGLSEILNLMVKESYVFWNRSNFWKKVVEILCCGTSHGKNRARSEPYVTKSPRWSESLRFSTQPKATSFIVLCHVSPLFFFRTLPGTWNRRRKSKLHLGRGKSSTTTKRDLIGAASRSWLSKCEANQNFCSLASNPSCFFSFKFLWVGSEPELHNRPSP